MRTIGRRVPAASPRGDTVALCGYCGVPWYRSQLRRDRSGNLACPDDSDGLDVVSLGEGNAALASRWEAMRGGGDMTGTVEVKTVPDAVPYPPPQFFVLTNDSGNVLEDDQGLPVTL